MRLEAAALLGELAYACQAENLKSAAVGEYRPVPRLETVQSARCPERVKAGPEIQVIGVSKNDLGFDIFLKITMIDAFNGADRTHGHKNGSPYHAVVGVEKSGTGRACAVLMN